MEIKAIDRAKCHAGCIKSDTLGGNRVRHSTSSPFQLSQNKKPLSPGAAEEGVGVMKLAG